MPGQAGTDEAVVQLSVPESLLKAKAGVPVSKTLSPACPSCPEAPAQHSCQRQGDCKRSLM